MARRPNFSLKRTERNRTKQAKREAKLRQQEEITAQRKAARSATEVENEPTC